MLESFIRKAVGVGLHRPVFSAIVIGSGALAGFQLGRQGRIVAAVAIFVLMPRYAPAQATPKSANGGPLRAPRRLAFPVLTTVGVLDSATRMAFLTFLPFVLTAKGASLPTVGVALTLVFAGGAVGKLACAFLGARIGTIATVWVTEIVTALGIAALLPLPL